MALKVTKETKSICSKHKTRCDAAQTAFGSYECSNTTPFCGHTECHYLVYVISCEISLHVCPSKQ
jgi:hypothetical protein